MTLLSTTRWVGFCAALLVGLLLPKSVAAQEEGSDEATRQYAAAVRFQNLESYDLAVEAWRKLLADFPTDPRADRATHYLGVCQFQQEQFDEALSTFERVVKDYPKLKNLDATRLYQGVTQYRLAQSGKTKMYQAAAQTLGMLITKYPDSKYLSDAIFYSGESLFQLEKRQEAIDRYSRLVKEFPEHRFLPDALYALGVAQEELRQFEPAGKTYDTFLKSFAKHELAVEVGMRRGETLFASGDFAQAAEHYASASATSGFPMADYSTLRQADAVAQQKQYAEAAALYRQLIEKFPKSEHVARANLEGGKCDYLAGDFDTAPTLLTLVLDAGGPGALEAAHWIAKSYLKQQKPAEALDVLAKVIPQMDASPFAPQLSMDQADATYDIPDRRAESIALYAAMAKKYPQDDEAPYALYMAGYAALEAADYQVASKHADTFLAKHHEHPLAPDVMHVAAESRLLLGEQAEAETRYADLLQKYADHSDAQLWRVRHGLALHGQEKYQETIDVLSRDVSKIRDKDFLAEAYYLLGSSHFELKQDAQAIAALEASLAAAPRWRQADETLLTLARSARRLDKLDEAQAAVRRLIAEFPESQILDRAHYRLGEYLYITHNYPEAVREYRKVVDEWPKSKLRPHALHELGCAELNCKQADESEKVLSTFIADYSGHPLITRARYARAMARHQLGKLEPSVEDLQAVLQAEDVGSLRSDARYVLGLCQMGLKEYKTAAITLEELLREDPEYSGADNVSYQLAWALKLSNQETKAAEQFSKLSEDFSDSPHVAEALYHTGESHYIAKEYQKAAVAYFSAMQKAGKGLLNEKAGHKLAWAYYHQNDYTKAIQTFRYQQKSYPKGVLADDAAFMEAECLFKEEQFAEALAKYDTVPDLKNDDFRVLALLHAGQSAGQLEQWPKSFSLLAECVEQFPESSRIPEALYEQAFAQEKLGKPDEAIVLYEKVIAKTSEEVAARAQFMIGEIQFGKKQHAEAVTSFFKVLYGYSYPTWQAESAYEAGRCFEVLGKKTQAVKVYQELIEKFPDHDKASLAKQRIEELRR